MTESPAEVADSVALSTPDFCESGVMVSLALEPRSLRLQEKDGQSTESKRTLHALEATFRTQTNPWSDIVMVYPRCCVEC